MKLKTENILETVQVFLAFVFVLSIAFSTAINNISFLLLLVISIVEYFLANKKKSLKTGSIGIISLILLGYLALDIFLFGNLTEDSRILLNYMMLFVFPFIFWGKKHFLENFKKAFLLAYAVFLLCTLYGIVQNFSAFGQFNFYKFGGGIQDFLVFERLYFGLSSVIAGILIVDLFQKKRILKYALLSLVLITNFVIVSRLAFGLLVVILLSQLVLDFRKKNGLTLGLVAIGLLLCIGLLGIRNEGFKKRFYMDSGSLEELVLQIKINEPRFAIWRCAFALDDPKLGFRKLTGYVSNDQIMENLVACYQSTVYIDDKREWFVESEYNTHNQFIYIYLLHGIIGLSLLAVFFLIFLYRRPNLIAWYFILTVLLFFSIENVLYRQIGTYLMAICFAFTFFSKKKITSTKQF